MKKHVPKEKTEQNSRKRTRQNKVSILPMKSSKLVIRMFNELRERVDELNNNFNKEIGNIKMEIEIITKEPIRALVSWFKWLDYHPIHKKFVGKSPYLGCRFDHWLGRIQKATNQCFSLTTMSLSLSPQPPSLLLPP